MASRTAFSASSIAGQPVAKHTRRQVATAAAAAEQDVPPPPPWAILPDVALRRISEYAVHLDPLAGLVMHLVCRNWHAGLGRVQTPRYWGVREARLMLFARGVRHIGMGLEHGWIDPGPALRIGMQLRHVDATLLMRALRDEVGGATTPDDVDRHGLETRLAARVPIGGDEDAALEQHLWAMRQHATHGATGEALHEMVRRVFDNRGRFVDAAGRIDMDDFTAECNADLPMTPLAAPQHMLWLLDTCMMRVKTGPRPRTVSSIIELGAMYTAVQQCIRAFKFTTWRRASTLYTARDMVRRVRNSLLLLRLNTSLTTRLCTGLLTLPAEPPAWMPLLGDAARIVRELADSHDTTTIAAMVHELGIGLDTLRSWNNYALRELIVDIPTHDTVRFIECGLTADDLFSHNGRYFTAVCYRGNITVARAMLGAGETYAYDKHVYSRGLYFACQIGHVRLARMLVDDARRRPWHGECAGVHAFLARDYVFFNNVMRLKYLIECGAATRVMLESANVDALRTAVNRESLSMVRYLVNELGVHIPPSLSSQVKVLLARRGG